MLRFLVCMSLWDEEKGFVCNNAKKDPTAATDNMKQLPSLNKVVPLTKLELVRFWGFLYSATVFSVEGTRLSFSSWCLTNWLLFFNLVCFVYNRIHQAQNIHTKTICVAGEKKPLLQGPTETWTRIAGFRVQSANHYTMGPLANFPSLYIYTFIRTAPNECLSKQLLHRMSLITPNAKEYRSVTVPNVTKST